MVNSIYRNQETWQSTSQKTASSQQSLEKFSGSDFAVLADELASNDARLYVESNGEAVFSNLKDDADEILGVTVSSTTHTSYVDGEIVISRKLATDGHICLVRRFGRPARKPRISSLPDTAFVSWWNRYRGRSGA
ncbi:TPA: hypothetical protein ACGOSC_000458 [Streptococcus suis]